MGFAFHETVVSADHVPAPPRARESRDSRNYDGELQRIPCNYQARRVITEFRRASSAR